MVEIVGMMKEKGGVRDMGHGGRDREEKIIEKIWMKYPKWEMKVEQIFACHKYSE